MQRLNPWALMAPAPCRCDHAHDSGTVDFVGPPRGSLSATGRTAEKSYELRLEELNAQAFG